MIKYSESHHKGYLWLFHGSTSGLGYILFIKSDFIMEIHYMIFIIYLLEKDFDFISCIIIIL